MDLHHCVSLVTIATEQSFEEHCNDVDGEKMERYEPTIDNKKGHHVKSNTAISNNKKKTGIATDKVNQHATIKNSGENMKWNDLDKDGREEKSSGGNIHAEYLLCQLANTIGNLLVTNHFISLRLCKNKNNNYYLYDS